MSRVPKKILVLDSNDPSASILVLNLYDPQVNTFKAMLLTLWSSTVFVIALSLIMV